MTIKCLVSTVGLLVLTMTGAPFAEERISLADTGATQLGSDAPAAPSCQGKCGQNLGSCWCDTACKSYGDCCPDYDQWCGLKTCQGKCGGAGIGGCWCDTACKSYGDCCPDYDHECPPSPECGNEVIDPGEDCDPPGPFCRGGCNVQLGICVDYSCRADCSCPDPVCGDYIIDAGEECDDGNTAPGDGCSSDCLLE
jgi:cysteine-rich repeat protein